VDATVNAANVKCDLARETLRTCGSLRLKTNGWSMLPLIWPGDVIVLESSQGSQVTPGDIVVFRHESRFVAHRVIERHRKAATEWVVTQGDALATPDAPIRPHQIVGKVTSILRNGRCYDAKHSLRRSERGLATLLRRSQRAARAMARVHVVLHKIRKSS